MELTFKKKTTNLATVLKRAENLVNMKKEEILLWFWMMGFPLMPKGIQAQEGLGTGGTCQLHP